MKKHLLLLSLSISISGFAQVRQWTNSYNDPSNMDDIAYAIATDAAGNSYVTGSMNDGSNNVMATIKYNSIGAQQWISTHTAGTGYSRDVTVDGAGNVYVTGVRNIGLSQDCMTIKYNNAGTEMWARNFDGPAGGAEEGFSVTTDNSGNVYVTGQTFNASGETDIATLKYNSSGTLQWSAIFNGSNDSADFGSNVQVDASGNVYVLGNTSSAGQGMNYIILKYDNNGTQLWATEINGTDQLDIARSMILDASGNAYVTGTIYTLGEVSNCGTAKIDAGGNIAWRKEYQGTGLNADHGYDIAIDATGNVYVTGTSVSFSSGFYDAITIKYDNTGNQLWVKEYNGLGNAADRGNAIALDALGNVFVTGQSNKPVGAPKKEDYLTIAYDTNGNLKWGDEYDGSASDNDYAFDVSVDNSGNAIVTGWATATGQGYNIVTIKYCTPPDTAGAVSGTNAVCQGQTGVTYTVPASNGATGYTWTLPPGATIASGSGTNTITVDFGYSSGSGYVTAQGTNSCGSGAASAAFAVTVYPAPAIPTISQSGNMMTSSAVSGNQWYLNGTLIPGATSQSYTATTSGNYTVVVTGANSCTRESAVYVMNVIGINELSIDLSTEIYPNPSSGLFTVNTATFSKGNYSCQVTDLLGKVILVKQSQGPGKLEIDLSNERKGIYFLEISSGDKVYRGKMIKE